MSKTKYIDYLTEDPVISNQQWVCVSFLSPEGIKNCSVRGLKIRGVYSTREEANKRAHDLQNIDPDFHVFVGEVGKWLPWDPSPDNVEENIYREKQLNDLMKGYKENLESTKQIEAERKSTLITEAARAEQEKTNNKLPATKERMKKILEDRKKKKNGELGNSVPILPTPVVENRAPEAASSSVDDKLNRIARLYEETKKKN